MRLEWSPAALRRLDEIADYLLENNPPTAQPVVAQIIAAGESLVTFPNRGRHSKLRARRELKVPGQPYFLLYRVGRDTVIIFRVVHNFRDWPPH